MREYWQSDYGYPHLIKMRFTLRLCVYHMMTVAYCLLLCVCGRGILPVLLDFCNSNKLKKSQLLPLRRNQKTLTLGTTARKGLTQMPYRNSSKNPERSPNPVQQPPSKWSNLPTYKNEPEQPAEYYEPAEDSQSPSKP